jgi:PAS domain S-box-containing protein
MIRLAGRSNRCSKVRTARLKLSWSEAMMAGALETARRAALVFVPTAAVAAVVFVALFQIQDNAAQSLIEASEARIIDQARLTVLAGLSSSAADVRYLTEEPELREWLDTADPEKRDALSGDYLAFVAAHPEYDLIRFFDTNGQEVVGVDRSTGAARIEADSELENLRDAYFVGETLKLGAGEIFQSAMDFRVEHGALVMPPRPTIRFAAPVFDSSGVRRGFVMINYLGQLLLDDIRKLGEGRPGALSLLNTEGDWLLGPNPEAEWSFRFPERQQQSFAAANPDAWKNIRQGDPVGSFRLGRDLYTYARLSPPAGAPTAGLSNSLILLSTRSGSVVAGATGELRRTRLIAASGFFLLLALISWVVARQWAERKRAEEAIHRSEAKFRNLIESAPDAVIVTDKAGKIVLANSRTESLFGHKRGSVIGQPVEMLVPGLSVSPLVREPGGSDADRGPSPPAIGQESAGLRADGSRFPVAVSLGVTVIDDDMLIFCDVRDISAEKTAAVRIEELNRDLAYRNTELETVNRELESFSYSVSHDLRAPLRAIDGFSQALLEDAADKLDAASKTYLNRMRNAAQRMGFLIDDLLNLARVSRAEISVDRVDLSALADDIARGLKDTTPGRQGQFAIDPDLVVSGDPRLMRVALENLLSNAWKFTSQRDDARIAFGSTGVNGEKTYFVRDNGAGFDMDYAGKLFGAFQRLHDAGSFPGTGVGLATVQRIVHKHGGRIWADARPEEGATFYFTLTA